MVGEAPLSLPPANLSPWRCYALYHIRAAKSPLTRANLARILQVDESAINVKAKTGEHVGPIGRGEAIACEAVVLLEALPKAEAAGSLKSSR